MVKAWWSHPIC